MGSPPWFQHMLILWSGKGDIIKHFLCLLRFNIHERDRYWVSLIFKYHCFLFQPAPRSFTTRFDCWLWLPLLVEMMFQVLLLKHGVTQCSWLTLVAWMEPSYVSQSGPCDFLTIMIQWRWLINSTSPLCSLTEWWFLLHMLPHWGALIRFNWFHRRVWPVLWDIDWALQWHPLWGKSRP